jgi:methylglutaconyl-CoA hydratase
MENQSILVDIEDHKAVISLNKPEVHNSLDEVVIHELHNAITELSGVDEVRSIVITGKGKSFCAGADLNWMKNIIDFSYEDNFSESLKLARLLYSIYTCPKPVIAMVNGPAIGGGAGLVCACDIAIAAEDSAFGFSEARLGLAPAVISPFVLSKIGMVHCRRLFLTGERISTQIAMEMGMINEAVPLEELRTEVERYVKMINACGPVALSTIKELLSNIENRNIESIQFLTAEIIAKLRTSPEGQEGMNSYLEKRKPSWIK